MVAALCTTAPAISVSHAARSPLLARQTGAPISGLRTPLGLPLTVVSAAAASLSRAPVLRSLFGSRGGLPRFRATSDDDSSASTFGYLGTVPKAETGDVKETGAEKDPPEVPVAAVEEVPAEEQPSSTNFFEQLDLQLDSEDTYRILIYGTGAFVALWISSAIVVAIDSLPLFPKVMEVIGLGFTVWFTYRYLLFKKNRDELFEKIDQLKEQILGPSVD